MYIDRKYLCWINLKGRVCVSACREPPNTPENPGCNVIPVVRPRVTAFLEAFTSVITALACANRCRGESETCCRCLAVLPELLLVCAAWGPQIMQEYLAVSSTAAARLLIACTDHLRVAAPGAHTWPCFCCLLSLSRAAWLLPPYNCGRQHFRSLPRCPAPRATHNS